MLLAPDQSQGVMNPTVFGNEDGAADIFVAAMLMDRVRRHSQNIVGFEMVSLAVIPFPALAADAKKRRRADVPMGTTHRGVRRDPCKVTGHAIKWTTCQHVVGDMVPGL